MAEITTTQSFADGDTVTAAKLNNILGNSSISSEIITNRSELTVVDGASDFILGYDTSASSLRKIKPNNIVGDASISTNKIANLSVTTGKMADLAVTTGKIVDSAVTTNKIAALSPNPEGTYGASSLIPTIVVNSRGQVTSVTTSALPVAESFLVGMVMPYAGSSAPSKWSLCDGSEISRTTYASLFSVIGTTYGAGNGSTTFRLPDLRGKTTVGAGTGSGLTQRNLADAGGAETVTLGINQIPSHSHSAATVGSNFFNGTAEQGTIGGRASSGSTGNAGGGQSHSNMQPFLVLNYIIYHGV